MAYIVTSGSKLIITSQMYLEVIFIFILSMFIDNCLLEVLTSYHPGRNHYWILPVGILQGKYTWRFQWDFCKGNGSCWLEWCTHLHLDSGGHQEQVCNHKGRYSGRCRPYCDNGRHTGDPAPHIHQHPHKPMAKKEDTVLRIMKN